MITTAITIVAILALVVWPFVVVWNFSLNKSDAAGNGWAAIYTIFGTLILWALLSAALILASPRWPFLVLLPLTCAAALAVTFLLDQDEPLHWMLVIQILVPPVVLAYIGWAMIPRIHTILTTDRPNAVVWGLMLALGLLPWTRLIGHKEWVRRRNEALAAVQSEWRARFDRLTPQSPLHEWMLLIDTRHGFYDEVVRKIKTLDNRQSGIEQMLNTGDYTGFEALWQLDLSVTPELGEGARRFLRDQSIAWKPTPKRRRYYPEVMIATQAYRPTLDWLATNGCRMLDELNAVESTLRTYPDSEKEDSLLFAAFSEMKAKMAPHSPNEMKSAHYGRSS